MLFLSDFKIDIAFQQRMEELTKAAQIKILDPDLKTAYDEYLNAAETEESPPPPAAGD
jgi:hypothetical protein